MNILLVDSKNRYLILNNYEQEMYLLIHALPKPHISSFPKFHLLCSHSPNDVPPVPQRNVSIAAYQCSQFYRDRKSRHKKKLLAGRIFPLCKKVFLSTVMCLSIGTHKNI